MNQQEMNTVAGLYKTRGPMTRTQFLATHNLTEGALRRAIKGSDDRQEVLPFVSPAKAPTHRITELEEENKRLRRALSVAELALKIIRDKTDLSIASMQQNLG